jgi:hypothetical protein
MMIVLTDKLTKQLDRLVFDRVPLVEPNLSRCECETLVRFGARPALCRPECMGVYYEHARLFTRFVGGVVLKYHGPELAEALIQAAEDWTLRGFDQLLAQEIIAESLRYLWFRRATRVEVPSGGRPADAAEPRTRVAGSHEDAGRTLSATRVAPAGLTAVPAGLESSCPERSTSR